MKMLVINPENRITAQQALKHPYFLEDVLGKRKTNVEISKTLKKKIVG